MFLYDQFGIKVVQSWLGCIIAATVIAFPLMYRNARAAFEQVDINLIYAGRTLGMSDMKIFWRIVVPNAGPGIASGTIRDGHPGSELPHCGGVGGDCAADCLCGDCPYQCDFIEIYEECGAVVRLEVEHHRATKGSDRKHELVSQHKKTIQELYPGYEFRARRTAGRHPGCFGLRQVHDITIHSGYSYA